MSRLILHRTKVDPLDLDRDAKPPGLLDRPQDLRRVQEYLRRDATAGEADAARLVLVDHRDPDLRVLLDERLDDVHRRARPHDHHVVLFHVAEEAPESNNVER
jgi:hypothetical protein